LNEEVAVALTKVGEAVEAIPTEAPSRQPDTAKVVMSAKERAIKMAELLRESKK
jgi:hypothetical protein